MEDNKQHTVTMVNVSNSTLIPTLIKPTRTCTYNGLLYLLEGDIPVIFFPPLFASKVAHSYAYLRKELVD